MCLGGPELNQGKRGASYVYRIPSDPHARLMYEVSEEGMNPAGTSNKKTPMTVAQKLEKNIPVNEEQSTCSGKNVGFDKL